MRKEHERLIQDKNREVYWKRWGPYLSERAWGTVREDYSANGDAWHYFTHDQARSRTYRWNEDGLAGICDRLAADTSVRCAVFRGAGGEAFVAGTDIEQFLAFEGGGASLVRSSER